MKSKKVIIGVIIAVAVVLTGVIGGAYLLTGNGRKSFPADGYVLEVTAQEEGQSVTGLAFSMGTGYQGKFPASFVFKDIQGKKNTVEEDSFIHYNDGSVSAFSDGMAVNMQEVGQGFLEFYLLKEGMVMTKASEGWEIDNNQNMMSFMEMLWELSENKVLAASDEMTLELPGREPETVSGYLEVTWVDKDIVQVANQDLICQSVVTGGRITYKNGAVLDLQQRAVLGKDGEVKVTLSELMADMDNGGITIQSVSNVAWQPPEFNIQVEDGKDGEAGKSGEVGETGEDGEIGEQGETGEQGEQGELGVQGEIGAQGNMGAQGNAGRQGNIGADGNVGADGEAGGTGTTGAGGGSAGSGGSGSGGSAGTVAENKLGTIRITDLIYDCSSVKVSLTALDESSTFLADRGVVEIRDARTNKLLAAETGADIRDEGAINKEFEFKDILSADREYVLVVKNDYAVAMQSGETNSGTKTFIKRNFFTSSEGVIMEQGKLTEGGLNLNLKKQPYSDATYYALRIKVGDQWICYPGAGEYEELQGQGAGSQEILLNIEDLLKRDLGEEPEWISSNLPYEIELYTSSTSNPALWEAGDNGEPKGTGGEIKKSAQVLKGKTLKEKPRIGEVNAVLTNNGCYDLSVNVERDKDKSIKNYRFVIKEDMGDLGERVLQELESTSYQTKWYFGTALQGLYKVSCEVTYYDNEKDNIVNAQEASITATATGSPSLSFEPYRNVNGEWVDHRNQVVESVDTGGASAVNPTRIWGELKLCVNGKEINDQTKLAIKVTSNNDTTYERVISQSLPRGQKEDDGSTVYWIPIKCLGLKADTVYTFDISGEVIDTLNVGDAAMSQYRVEWLGTASVKTTGINGTGLSDKESVAGFSITTRVNDSQNKDLVAALQLYPDIKGGYSDKNIMNSTDKESKYYFERSVARAVQIKVSLENGTILGTIVKDLYPTDWSAVLVDVTGTENELEETGDYSLAESSYFFKGPLVADPGEEHYLYKDDFRRAGIDIDAQRGKIVLTAEALYDYSYDLQKDSGRYSQYFLSDEAVNYNVMPLNVVDIYSGGAKVQSLNEAVIDLGEKPPTLFNPAHTGVTVTELKNVLSNETGYVEADLLEDTTIGLKAACNYPNDNGDTTEITYYAMTRQALRKYEEGAPDKDIIKAYREYKESSSQAPDKDPGVLFDITLNVRDYVSDKGVPPLYVVFTENEEYLKKCRTEKADAPGQYEYHAIRDNKTNRAIFYTNLMERGHCYVFAFTLKSMYHVNTMTGETAEAWEFPYDITAYVSTEVYNNQIQRSAGTEVYKETPRIAAYLDHTTIKGVSGADGNAAAENSAVWKYLVYDPDGAMYPDHEVEVGKVRGRLYAGTKESIVSQVSQDRLGEGLSASLLTCTKENETQVTAAHYGSWKDILRSSFGLSAFPERGEVWSFDVTVENGAAVFMNGYNVSPYEVWFAVQEFDDEYTGREDGSAPPYKTTRRENTLLINDAEHFAISTVRHRYDAFENTNMTNLKVTVTLSGADNVLIDVDKDSNAVNQIVGFYYELRPYGSSGSSADAEQWGFIQYTDNMLIPLQEPQTGAQVELYLRVVYDTGIAGLNRDNIPSSIHKPRAESADEKPAISNRYYAIQKQESNLYATGENINTRQLLYQNATAGNSLYQVSDRSGSASDQVTSNHMYDVSRWNSRYQVPLKYIYGSTGAYLETSSENLPDMPLLKGLAESEVALEVSVSTGQDDIKKEDGKVIITVPAVVPNISAKGISNNGFHSVDINVTLTKKSVEALLLTDSNQKYEPEIYLELYEKGHDGASDSPLDNTGNRYFALVSEQEAGKYDNKAEGGTAGSGWRINGSSNVTAYFETRPAATDADRNYHIAVRNLEMNTSYVFKMYCKDTKGDKVYIIDNDTSAGRPSGAPVALEFTLAQYLNVGKNLSADSLQLTAEYEHKEYGKRNLNVGYSLNRTGDIYLQYQIKAENGNAISNAGPDDMMRYLGYINKEEKTFWHYDADGKQWVSIKYPVYTQAGGKIYSPSARQSETYQLEGTSVLNSAGNFKLEITAYDLYTGKSIHCYQDGGELNRGAVPTTSFTVPVRGSIMVEPKVTYERDKNEDPAAPPSYKARLTLTVRDNGLRLGVKKADGTLEMGSYRVVLEKAGATAGSWEEVKLEGSMVAGARNGELFLRGTTYTITYPVKEGERYRLRVQGVDILDLNHPNQEQDLYDSENDSRMKVDLSVTALDKPQLGNPAFDFNIHTGDFTISVQRGSNLDRIKQASITLYNMSGANGQVSAYETVTCSFGPPDDKGWQDMVIPLSNILDDWKKNDNVEEKDSLVLTVQYMGDGALLGESTFSFMYR